MRNKCGGAALVVALLIVALSTAFSTHMLWRGNQWFGQQESLRDQAQAREIAYAGLKWAGAVLTEDKRTNAYDYDREPWATIVPVSEAEGGFVSGQLVDEQAKWNINNLSATGAVARQEWDIFRRLLVSAELPVTLVAAVVDWIDADNELREGGAEDAHYLNLKPAYLPRNGLFANLDELVFVRGFDAAAVERLRPLVTVLPRYTPININDASIPVLSAVLFDFSDDEVQRIAIERKRVPFQNIQDFFRRVPKRDNLTDQISPNLATQLDVKTDYFSARISSTYGRSVVELHAMLDRRNARPEIVSIEFE